MIEDQKILRELSLLERKGVHSITQRLKDIDVDLNTQIAEIQKFFDKATEKVREGRKATLRCLSQVYFVLAVAYRSEDDFHALCKAMSIKVSYKRRKKPLILIIQGLLGVDGKKASKWSKVIRLGFRRRVSPDAFFDHVDGLGGIDKAVEEHKALERTSKSESGREGDGTAEPGTLRYVEGPGGNPSQQPTYSFDRQEQPSIQTVYTAGNDNSSPTPQAAEASGVTSVSPSGVEGSGWEALTKIIADATRRRKKIRKIAEIEIRASGKVDLRNIITEKQIVRRVSEFEAMKADVMRRALEIVASQTARGTRASATTLARRKRRS